jgi:imidazoleglycerol-phosphate dehydratase
VRTYYDVPVPSIVEGMDKDDIETFLDGFVQGANCTLHIILRNGENGHHIYESMFRALGRALASTLAISESRRKGLTAGVAGEIIWEVENDEK